MIGALGDDLILHLHAVQYSKIMDYFWLNRVGLRERERDARCRQRRRTVMMMSMSVLMLVENIHRLEFTAI